MYSVKLGSRFARLASAEPLMNNLIAKTSTEFIASEEYNLIKSKLFTRLTKGLGSERYFQMQLSAGYIANLPINAGESTRSIRFNDAFHLSNFKGVSNIGNNLGLDRFATLGFKVSQMHCPLLENLETEPFAYANFALAPNKYKQDKQGASWLGRHLRWSTGIGLTCQHKNFALECYYNIMVSAQKNEIRNNF